jgi:cyclic beta-1,2-glucan synthetase
MYRIGLETLLGFRREGDSFSLDPRIPADWPGFELTCTHERTRYSVRVRNPDGVERGVLEVTLDGEACPNGRVKMTPGGGDHEVIVVMGQTGRTAPAGAHATSGLRGGQT